MLLLGLIIGGLGFKPDLFRLMSRVHPFSVQSIVNIYIYCNWSLYLFFRGELASMMAQDT